MNKPSFKTLIILFLLVAMGITMMFLYSCDDNDKNQNDNKLQKQQEQQQKELNNQIGLPDIVNWSEKKNMKYIYELRDRTDLICYLYTKSDITGKYIYEGECMGYGIPYSTQFSNPEKVVDFENYEGVHDYSGSSPGTVPQSEPNGLFMPTSSSATWIIRLTEKGEPKVEYYEPCIVVSPTKKPKRLCESWSLPDNY